MENKSIYDHDRSGKAALAYLRARRLSQAEIEKLYAVENFYEYIQNYLLQHKDVFNYPYQKCADSILYPED